MLVGFNKGYIIAISTHMREIGEELQSLKLADSLVDIVYSSQLNKFAAINEEGIRIVDCTDWKEIKSEYKHFNRDEGEPDKIQWTRDGQILTVSTTGGFVFNYLMSMPTIAGYNNNKIAYLSLLRQVSIMDITAEGILYINNYHVL